MEYYEALTYFDFYNKEITALNESRDNGNMVDLAGLIGEG